MKKSVTSTDHDFAWPTVQRLSEYLIILEQFLENSKEVISSSELAEIYSNTPSQVRQDLYRLPNTGRVGQGYRVRELAKSIRQILGVNEIRPLVIIGCGKMGAALAEHVPFKTYGMELAGIFDKDSAVVGSDIVGIKVRHMDEVVDYCRENSIRIASLCVPADAAQDVADVLVEANVTAILNFTRKRLRVPENVFVQHQQIICSFMQLAYMSRASEK